MNLYYAVTNYHLLCCILHAIKYHGDKKNILYLSNWHPDHIILLEKLHHSGIFADVKIYVEVVFPSGNKKISNKQVDLDIEKILEKIPKNFICDVQQSDNIYIAGDYYSSSLYLIHNEIKYSYIEEACGVLSDEERLMKNIRNIDYSRYQIMIKLKLPGNHKFIINRYGDLDHQLEGYFNKKDVHFSVPTLLNLLNEDQINTIVSIFSNERISIPDKSMLVLTFHYINMQLLTYDKQRLLYYMLIDYFTKGNKLVIKQHPSDIQPNYSEWFPNSIVLPRQMPSELLPILCKHTKLSRVLTAYSTSIFALKKYCNNVISFGSNIEKTFLKMNKYYFLLLIVNKILMQKKFECIFIGTDNIILNQLIEEYHFSNISVNSLDTLENAELDENKLVVLDDYSLDNLHLLNKSSSLFLLLNFKQIMEQVDDLSYYNIYPVFIKKQIIDKKRYYDSDTLKDELMGFVNASEDIKNIIAHVNDKKSLKWCNIEVSLENNAFRHFIRLNSTYQKTKSMKNQLLKQNEVYADEIKKLTKNIENLKEILENKNKELDKILSINDEINKNLLFYKQSYENICNSSSWKLTYFYRKIGFYVKNILVKWKGLIKK